MPKIHHFSEDQLDTCETCNRTDLTVKRIGSHYVCDKCNKNRCITCLNPVKGNLEQGLYCSDCASFMLHSNQYNDMFDSFY